MISPTCDGLWRRRTKDVQLSGEHEFGTLHLSRCVPVWCASLQNSFHSYCKKVERRTLLISDSKPRDVISGDFLGPWLQGQPSWRTVQMLSGWRRAPKGPRLCGVGHEGSEGLQMKRAPMSSVRGWLSSRFHFPSFGFKSEMVR